MFEDVFVDTVTSSRLYFEIPYPPTEVAIYILLKGDEGFVLIGFCIFATTNEKGYPVPIVFDLTNITIKRSWPTLLHYTYYNKPKVISTEQARLLTSGK